MPFSTRHLATDAILVATRSADKLEEIRAILSTTGLKTARLRSLADLAMPAAAAEDEIEIFDTFIENAAAKARYFAQLTGMPTLADDSGIVVDALAGGPGVRTRRFAVDHAFVPADTAGKDLDRANNLLLLEKLKDVQDEQRVAHYVCAAVLHWDDRTIGAVGTCSGRIARAEKGGGGFGYDPLFCIPELSITFAELTRAQKNARSHRAIAVRALAPHLK